MYAKSSAVLSLHLLFGNLDARTATARIRKIGDPAADPHRVSNVVYPQPAFQRSRAMHEPQGTSGDVQKTQAIG